MMWCVLFFGAMVPAVYGISEHIAESLTSDAGVWLYRKVEQANPNKDLNILGVTRTNIGRLRWVVQLKIDGQLCSTTLLRTADNTTFVVDPQRPNGCLPSVKKIDTATHEIDSAHTDAKTGSSSRALNRRNRDLRPLARRIQSTKYPGGFH
ncbi:hypothetical protein BIW11_05240 [Tropilaelaps mercedesae]|uniref:Uncharacterized protein n=1 Tax=Tropilaelaps mercedesae TaxID=418985 RepID=A0A1V9Y350_9ACAR|nr:hypothetical protein BIW11_05240 [Tropilaelaps mercedesae]